MDNNKNYCPYLDKDCPKVVDLDKEVTELKNEIKKINYYLYMIIGMIAVNWGINLW